MKLPASKRSELGEFPSAVQRRRLDGGVHSALGKRGVRLPRRLKRPGKVTAASARGVTGRVRLAASRVRSACRTLGFVPSGPSSEAVAGRGVKLLPHVWCRASRRSSGAVPRVRRDLAAWFPALRPTRLETRTKELSSAASHEASRTLTA